jgi:anthranilate phosphoribosyltransferase
VHDEGSLRAFGALIVRIQQGGHLSRHEASHAFTTIWRNEQPELQQGVFIEALRSRGPSPDEMAGFIDSFEAAWFAVNPGSVGGAQPHVMVCGVGSDSLKTVNVSSGASIIAAACGLRVHKVCAPGMTGVSGSADVFAIAGVDPHVPHEAALRACREGGLGVTSVVGAHALPVGHVRVLGSLRCATVLHLGGPMSRFSEDERHKMVGVPAPPLTRFVVEGLKAAGFETAISPCGTAAGAPGRFMDEFSNAGPTFVARLAANGAITEYVVHPEDAGLTAVPFEKIAAAATRDENVANMLDVIEGRHEDGPVLELLALNAAALLEQMGHADSLASGVTLAREAVASGKAAELLRHTRALQNLPPA